MGILSQPTLSPTLSALLLMRMIGIPCSDLDSPKTLKPGEIPRSGSQSLVFKVGLFWHVGISADFSTGYLGEYEKLRTQALISYMLKSLAPNNASDYDFINLWEDRWSFTTGMADGPYVPDAPAGMFSLSVPVTLFLMLLQSYNLVSQQESSYAEADEQWERTLCAH